MKDIYVICLDSRNSMRLYGLKDDIEFENEFFIGDKIKFGSGKIISIGDNVITIERPMSFHKIIRKVFLKKEE
jgi:hypothetical protein